MPGEPTTTMTEESVAYCPVVHGVIELIGRRWSGAILKVLLNSPRSFSAIRAEIPGLSDRLLTERLNELIGAGLVLKDQAERAGTYDLTPMGRDLRPIFGELEGFATRWVDTLKPA